MADAEQLAILRQGARAWNAWRIQHDLNKPDLTVADLHEANLTGANLTEADLSWADLTGANLHRANLTLADLAHARLMRANVTSADLEEANLTEADLTGVDMRGAELIGADLRRANLTGADLRGADLSEATLVETTLTDATLAGARIYGISAWNVQLGRAVQTDLFLSRFDEPSITVDNLEMAQFLYLMLHNAKIRDVIDTLTTKVVLILGRFTPERKRVLDALREELRQRNYVPVLFDFEGPERRDFTETVTLLARMARFVIADLTEPSSIPQELQAIVPDVAVPVQPLIAAGAKPFAMFVDHRKYHWMLPTYEYASLEELLTAMQERVIAPAEAKIIELRTSR